MLVSRRREVYIGLKVFRLRLRKVRYLAVLELPSILSGRHTGLPPIRTSQQSIGAPVDTYSVQRSAAAHGSGSNVPHLTPLSIPGSTNGVHGFAPSYTDYGMDIAARSGLSRHSSRGAAATFVGGDSDDSYFDYMLNEIPYNADGLFSTGDISPQSGVGLANAHNNGPTGFTYGTTAPQNHYRDSGLGLPMSSTFSTSGQGPGRSTSYQHPPAMQPYVASSFGSR